MRRPRRSPSGFAGAPSCSQLVMMIFVLVVCSSSLLFSGHQCLAAGREEAHRRSPVPAPPPPTTTTSFSVLHYGAVGDGATDDTKAFLDAWSAACAVRASTVVVPASFRFLVGPATFAGDSCQPGTVFQLDGTVVANTGSPAWRAAGAGAGGVSQWLLFKNVSGLAIRGSGTVDGQGSHWWSGGHAVAGDHPDMELDDDDRVGSVNRPTAVRVFQGRDVAVEGITIKNSAKFHLTFDACRAVDVRGVTVSSPGDSPNTDGVHLAGSAGVSIQNATVACGDDCVSIQGGCSDVLIRGVACGPGHGISIGGLGKGGATAAAVSGVTVEDVSLAGTTNGVRIKTWQGGSGSVRGVRFAGIRVSAVRTPIVIDQYYCDGAGDARRAACANQTAAVEVSGVAYEGVTGTYTERPVYLACSDGAPCTGIRLAGVQLAPVQDGYRRRLSGPFCWKAYGAVVGPVQPPVDCLMAGPH